MNTKNSTNKKKGGRKAPRPSRKGIAITPYKGGRVARFECRLTEIENEIITQLVQASGLSKSDWLMSVAQPTPQEPDGGKSDEKYRSCVAVAFQSIRRWLRKPMAGCMQDVRPCVSRPTQELDRL